MVKTSLLCLMISTASSCAASLQPTSMPASAETEAYVSINQAEPAPADGFFLSIPAARAVLKAQRLRELDLQEQLAEADLQRDAAEKKEALDIWCARWCLPIGLVLGIAGGSAFGAWAGSKK